MKKQPKNPRVKSTAEIRNNHPVDMKRLRPILLEHYEILGLTRAEARLTSQILKYEKQKPVIWTSQETMSADTGVSVRTIQRLFRKLKENFLLTIVERVNDNGTRSTNNWHFGALLKRLEATAMVLPNLVETVKELPDFIDAESPEVMPPTAPESAPRLKLVEDEPTLAEKLRARGFSDEKIQELVGVQS